jgi:hypothetical protein
VKNIALAATLVLGLCGHAQAGLAELVPDRANINLTVNAAAVQPGGTVVLQSDTSELAEPEMFAMMLLGLCLIGYRVTRDSSEKFS